uniref:Uncharacterized protein n=1 Tax=Glossina pallidipes TaxID=7398 RepID=A0A1A9ZKD5_GLOPL
MSREKSQLVQICANLPADLIRLFSWMLVRNLRPFLGVYKLNYPISQEKNKAKLYAAQPSRHDDQVQFLLPKRRTVEKVSHRAGTSSNCMKIVVKAGSITNGTKNRKANMLKVPSNMKKAVV